MTKQHDLSSLDTMPALSASSEDLKKAAQAAIEPQTEKDKEKEAQKKDPRTKPVYPFDFEWTDARGKTWSGKFQNTRLTIRQQQSVGVLQSQFAGSLPYESLDPMTREINLMLSHMILSLDEEIRPPWAKDVRDLDSVPLLQALYAEVARHEAIFHGLPTLEG